jgi:hypothetical protein
VAKAIRKIGDTVIDLIFYSLNKMKEIGVNSVTISSINDNVKFTDSTGTLTIRSNCHINSDNLVINSNFPHYSYNQNDFEAEFTKIKKVKELDAVTIGLGKDLHSLLDHVEKLPLNPPMRNKAIFSKKIKYREAIISHLNTAKEFKFFCGTQRIDLIPYNQKNDNQTNAIRSFNTSLPIRVQEASLLTNTREFTDEFRNVVKELLENIFFSVTGETKEQGNKEMA